MLGVLTYDTIQSEKWEKFLFISLKSLNINCLKHMLEIINIF